MDLIWDAGGGGRVDDVGGWVDGVVGWEGGREGENAPLKIDNFL